MLCICSVYGNVLVILVIVTFRRLRTATNILILNLAIGRTSYLSIKQSDLADLLISVFCMPFSYWAVLIFDDQRWIFGEFMCSLLSFLQGVAVFLSSWTLVVIRFVQSNKNWSSSVSTAGLPSCSSCLQVWDSLEEGQLTSCWPLGASVLSWLYLCSLSRNLHSWEKMDRGAVEKTGSTSAMRHK